MDTALNQCLREDPSATRSTAVGRANDGEYWLPLWSLRSGRRTSVARGAYAQALADLAQRPDDAVSLSIAVPFCASHCLCCDRDIQVAQADAVVDGYIDTLVAEFELLARHVGGKRDIWHLHLGGGTVTELDESHVSRLMHALKRHWRLPDDADTSLDCDPRRASEYKLRCLGEAGFRQITFGVLDLNPAVQRAIGRTQTRALIDNACEMARSAGFETITLEVMVGLPEQTPMAWQATIQRVLELAPDRVRVARYHHRPDRASVQYGIDARTLPASTECEAMAAQAADMLCEAGYRWIGTDLFVLETDKLAQAFDAGELRRNLLSFSPRPPAPTLALGIGATSEIDGHLFRNDASLGEWRSAIGSGNFAVNHVQPAREDQLRRRQAAERMLCTLEFPAAMAHDGLEAAYQRIASHAREGLVTIHEDRLSITRAGQHALADLCAELLDAA